MEISNFIKIKKALPKHVNLVAVSKGFGHGCIQQIYEHGQINFGESKVQEALPKKSFFDSNKEICWHFIGRIQSN